MRMYYVNIACRNYFYNPFNGFISLTYVMIDNCGTHREIFTTLEFMLIYAK